MSALPKMADKKSLKNLVPLNGLSNTHFEELARKATILELKPGKFLFKKGERDNATCYVLSGEIALHDGSDIKLTIQGGTEEARHPIAPQQPRQISARAKTNCTIISIDSGLLDVMLAWEQSAGYEVAEIESEGEEDWMTRMMQSDLMQRLPANNLQQLFIRMKEVPAKPGDVIVNQDDDGDYYYIIKQGKCIVSRKPSAKARPVKLAELSDGDSFGEESLLSGSKRNASVTMLTDGKLMRLAKQDFDELLKAPLLSQLIYKDAQKLVEKGAVYVDVRLPGEYANSHLDGSVNIPLAAIRNEIADIDRSKVYIVYCDTGRRSTSAVFLLGQFGIDAHVLSGGLSSVPMEEYEQAADSVAKSTPDSAEVININRDANTAQVDSDEIKAAVAEKEKFQAEADGLKNEVQQLKKNIETTTKALDVKSKEIEALNASIIEEKKRSDSAAEDLMAAQKIEVELSKFESKLKLAQDELEAQKSLLVNAHESEEQAQKKIIAQGKQLEKSEKALEVAIAKASESEDVNEQASKELEILSSQKQSLEKTIEQLKEKQESLQREKDALSKDADGSLNSLNSEIESLRVSLDESRVQKVEIEKDLHEEREQSLKVKKEVESLEQREQELKSQLSEQKQILEKNTEEHLQAISKEKALLQDKIDGLKEKSANELGQSEINVNNLKQQVDDLKGIRGQLEKEAEDTDKKLIKLKSELDKLGNEKSANIIQLEKEFALVKDEKEFIDNKCQQLEGSLAEQSQKNEALSIELVKVQEGKEVSQKEIQQGMEKVQSELDQVNKQLKEQMDRLSEVGVEKSRLEQDNGVLKAELQDLKEAQKTEGNVSKNQISELQRQLGEISSERHSLSETVASLSRELEELNASKQGLEASQGAVSQQLQEELERLKSKLQESERKLDEARLMAKDHGAGNEELRKELVALRAVYVQKEEDVEKLQKELLKVNEDIAEYQQKGSSVDEEVRAAKEALKQVQGEYEQLANENNGTIEQLKRKIEEHQSAINEARDNVKKEESLREDAESSFGVMEDELKQYKSESESFKNKLEESQLTITTMEAELHKLQQAQQDWRIKENDAAQGVELDFSKSRIRDLEQELKDSQHGMSEARDAIERLEKKLSLEKHMSDTDNNLQGQIEKLKSEMEVQLEKYKTEVDRESSGLRKENENLQKQLSNLHKEHEVTIAAGGVFDMTGSDVQEKPAKREPARSLNSEVDHSALFDMPDMDKDLFNNRVHTQPAKSNVGLIIMVALLFSMVSAGGVYWFFVMGKEQLPVPSKVKVSSDIPDKAVVGIEKSVSTKKKALVKKPLFNFDKTKKSAKKVVKADDGLLKAARVFSDFLKSGGSGPIMTGVPAGLFKMGSPSSSVHFDERPQHAVAIKEFSIAKYEVSFAQYDRFTAATGRPRPSDNGWGRGKRPVVNVSWKDANAYTEWLSRETGHVYRLPTEAEWEYAARSGTETKYWWGPKADNKRANCFNCGSQWDRVSTAPVGRFESNSLGLHDMTGNVMEWASDCYHNNFDGAPTDGSSWNNGKCEARVARGGSYRSTADNIRITKRTKFSADTALDQVGFRVVRVR